jgi:hypothetical protein
MEWLSSSESQLPPPLRFSIMAPQCLVPSSSFIFDKESSAQVSSVRVPAQTRGTGSVTLTCKSSQFYALNTRSQTSTLLMFLFLVFVLLLLLLLLKLLIRTLRKFLYNYRDNLQKIISYSFLCSSVPRLVHD